MMKRLWKKTLLGLNKIEAKWTLPLIALVIVVSFQNCGGEMQSLDEFKYGSEYAKNIVEQAELQSYWDSIYNFDSLMNQNEIVFDSRRDQPSAKFFVDSTTSFFVVTNRNTNSSLTMTVDQDQVLKITVQGSKVRLVHEGPAANFSEVTFSIDSSKPVVVGARAGRDPKNIMLMVNGEYRTFTIQTTGTPVNYSFLENSLAMTNIQEALIFKRAMEPGEINVISRQIASEYQIPTRTSSNMPDYLAWSSESPYFPQVRALMKNTCFKCHSSWISLSESGFTTASSYTGNIQLVKPKSLEESPIWHSLKGSVDNNAAGKRDMPKDLPGLSADQLNLIKTWIFAIP